MAGRTFLAGLSHSVPGFSYSGHQPARPEGTSAGSSFVIFPPARSQASLPHRSRGPRPHVSPLLLLGALLGYALLIWSNPVRASLLDGVRAVRRYPVLALIFGAFGFAYALFQLGLRVYLNFALPTASSRSSSGRARLTGRSGPGSPVCAIRSGTCPRAPSRSLPARRLCRCSTAPRASSITSSRPSRWRRWRRCCCSSITAGITA